MVFIWILGALGLGVAVYRWIAGLGATTALTDGRGWGLWISFDMMSRDCPGRRGLYGGCRGLHLQSEKVLPHRAPGHPDRLHQLFPGILALLVDLGQPLRIWHLIIYWNIHSPLFEIGWCVMLYTIVLALEFSPVLFEALGLESAAARSVRAITIPLIIAGMSSRPCTNPLWGRC